VGYLILRITFCARRCLVLPVHSVLLRCIIGDTLLHLMFCSLFCSAPFQASFDSASVQDFVGCVLGCFTLLCFVILFSGLLHCVLVIIGHLG
jgi:hypothetical protein